MAKRHVVELTEEERAQLQAIGKKGKVVARRIRRAQYLLLAAEGYTNTEIATALQVGEHSEADSQEVCGRRRRVGADRTPAPRRDAEVAGQERSLADCHGV